MTRGSDHCLGDVAISSKKVHKKAACSSSYAQLEAVVRPCLDYRGNYMASDLEFTSEAASHPEALVRQAGITNLIFCRMALATARWSVYINCE